MENTRLYSLRYEPVISSAVSSSVSIHAQSHPFLHVLGHSIPSSGLSLQWYYHLKKPFSISQGISVSFCQRQRLHFSSVAYSSTKQAESFAYRRNWNPHLWFLGKSPHHPPAGAMVWVHSRLLSLLTDTPVGLYPLKTTEWRYFLV